MEVFFGASTSLMETSTVLLLQRQHGQGNLCEISLPCVHVHTPSASTADRRENPPAAGWDAGAALLWDVWIAVLKDWVTQIWYQKGSSKHLCWCILIPEVPVAIGREKGALFITTPDHSQGLEREHRLLSMSGLHVPLFQAGQTM